MNEQNDPEKKIIVDEDWKTQVEREKEQLTQPAGEPAAESSEEASSPQTESSQAESPQAESSDTSQLPPASFGLLVSSLATQAMAAFGLLPLEDGGQSKVDLDLARHCIDMLAMLQEKTKGNLDAEEDQMLEDAVHQLRLLFVQIQQS